MNEMTLAEFAVMLAQKGAGMQLALRSPLEIAAQHVEAAAKKKFGVYQAESHGFSAWAPLADATKADRVRQGYTPDDPLLRSGELRDSITHQTGLTEAVIGSEQDLMVWQEMGTERIPPRPVLGPTGAEEAPHIVKLIGAAAVSWLVGGNRWANGRNLLGGEQ